MYFSFITILNEFSYKNIKISKFFIIKFLYFLELVKVRHFKYIMYIQMYIQFSSTIQCGM